MTPVKPRAERAPADNASAAPADDASQIKGWRVPGLDYPLLRLLMLAKALERVNQRTIVEQAWMTFAEWRVLSRLATVSEATVKQIAELVWSDKAEVSRAVTALKRRGFITDRENPADRRAPLLSCTDDGRSTYHRILPLRQAYYHKVNQALTREELAELDRILGKLHAAIA